MKEQQDNNEQIMVTVLCRTYNKIEFVRQSLEGVAMQKNTEYSPSTLCRSAFSMQRSLDVTITERNILKNTKSA